MKKLFLNIFLLFFLSTLPLSAKIVALDEIACFEEAVGLVDAHSLLLFDVDYTLIIPEDVVLGPKGKKLIHHILSEIKINPRIIPEGLNPIDFLFGRVLQTTHFVAVESKAASLISSFQERGIPTLALTAAIGGPLGEITSFADFRIQQLKELDFDFSHTLPEIECLPLTQLDSYKERPLFKSGVIFSSKHPKGVVLNDFLNRLSYYPNKVVFIDDSLSFIRSVEKAMEELGIEFVGIHYTAAEKLSCPVDEKLARFQFYYLAQYGEWLSDAKALAILASELFN